MPVKPLHAVAIQGVIQKKGFIDLPSLGNSMYPLIKEGDICRFVTCNFAHLTEGDILLYHLNGELVAHRLIEKMDVEGNVFFQCKGDTNLGKDQWVMEKDVIGKLLYIKRNKRVTSTLGRTAKVWGWSILSLPMLSSFLRFYINKKGV